MYVYEELVYSNTWSRSSKDSENPTVYVATEMVFAMVNMSPIEPPSAGPSALEIM